jgi:hypothetical protein
MSFSTLWLQLLGFTAMQASTLLGGVISGSLGDWVAQRRPLSGRIMVAPVSVAAGIPLMLVLLVLLPASPALRLCWAAYGATMLVGGATISWTWAGCISPMFADIVPPRRWWACWPSVPSASRWRRVARGPGAAAAGRTCLAAARRRGPPTPRR